MVRNHIEAQFEAVVDSGELLGMLADGESLGAWEGNGTIHIFWPEERWNADARRDLERALRQLGAGLNGSDITVSVVPDRDWNTCWAESVKPILIGKRVLVRQSWNAASPSEGGFALTIDPKRAFGTGYHATTQLLVEWLVENVRGGERVLDIGTGTGILAMVALRAGAAVAVAIDNDPVALECARENAAVNGFGPELELRLASLEGLGDELFDLVVANLDRRTILTIADGLARNLKPGGRLLISGLQVEDAADIGTALATWGGEIIGRRECEEWLALEVKFE